MGAVEYMRFGRRQKYGAIKTNGFDSKLESAVYDILVIRQNAGEIKDIEKQPIVILQDGPRDIKITMRVDFSYIDVKTGKKIFVEAKGVPTRDYKLKLKIWKANPPAGLEIYMGTYYNPKLVEKIEK